jgi:CBS domain-containing protein
MTPKPRVSEFMATTLFTLAPDTDIRDAVDFLLKHQISGAPVVDQTGALVGVISEQDCLRLVAAGANHERVAGTVAKYMTRDPLVLPPDMDVYFAAGLFLNKPYRRFPIVEDGKLVGLISRCDILRAVQQLMPRP